MASDSRYSAAVRWWDSATSASPRMMEMGVRSSCRASATKRRSNVGHRKQLVEGAAHSAPHRNPKCARLAAGDGARPPSNQRRRIQAAAGSRRGHAEREPADHAVIQRWGPPPPDAKLRPPGATTHRTRRFQMRYAAARDDARNSSGGRPLGQQTGAFRPATRPRLHAGHRSLARSVSPFDLGFVLEHYSRGAGSEGFVSGQRVEAEYRTALNDEQQRRRPWGAVRGGRLPGFHSARSRMNRDGSSAMMEACISGSSPSQDHGRRCVPPARDAVGQARSASA